MGRKCSVPHCYTGYRKCKDKSSLYRVPDDDYFLSQWQQAISREDRPITPKDYVCEKHFKEEDILRTRSVKDVVEVYLRPRLKPDAVPSIFPDLPESIPKMVRKRRKFTANMLLTDECSDKTLDKIIGSDNPVEDNLKSDIKNETQEVTYESSLHLYHTISNNEIEIKSEVDEAADASFETNQAILETEEPDSNESKMFHCNVCAYKTKYSHNLRTHKSKHLTVEDAMLCPYCPNYKTKWQLTFTNHLKVKHRMNERERKLYLQQREQSKGTRKIRPSKNRIQAESRTQLEFQKPPHTTIIQKSFKCTECNYETNSKTHILNHIKSVHITGDDTVVTVNSKNSDVVKDGGFRSDGRSVYKCVRCPYKTRFHSLLLKHIYKHTTIEQIGKTDTRENQKCKVWKCPNCPYATFFEQTFNRHRESECKNSNFNCAKCLFTTNYKPDYVKHILIHKHISIEPRKSENPDEVKDENVTNEHNQNLRASGITSASEFVSVKEEIYSEY